MVSRSVTAYRLLLAGIALLLLLTPACAQQPEERILKYHSDITMNADATMRVRETITVRSASIKIIHGIYRQIPTRYMDQEEREYTLKYTIKEVLRDGKPEKYSAEKYTRSIRIYIGDPDVVIPAGEHTYVLTYDVDRPLLFLRDHNELYWNVTGNDWAFPIDQASATVTLPKVVPKAKLKLQAFTGPLGAKEKKYTASVDTDGKAQFVTTAPLAVGEGLTILISFPKDLVTQPAG